MIWRSFKLAVAKCIIRIIDWAYDYIDDEVQKDWNIRSDDVLADRGREKAIPHHKKRSGAGLELLENR